MIPAPFPETAVLFTISQCLMAGPLLLLYGLSIGVAYVFRRDPVSRSSDEDEGTSEDGDG